MIKHKLCRNAILQEIITIIINSIKEFIQSRNLEQPIKFIKNILFSN